MAIIDEFIKKTGEFYGELKVQDRHRYCSWEHCYAQFYEARQNPEKPNIDNLSLHLAFYLASWGMYRGSSFLLQYDYTIHTFVVEEILKQAKDEIMSFLKGTNEQIARISSYLLAYESVDKETLAKILNENY